MKIKVGSRESKLAVIQSQIVIDAIKKKNPDIEVELVTMKTTGDIILNKTLDKIGGKGLFVKELDRALLNGDADITVHSFKDMPMDVDERLPIVAVSKREDARDVLILPKGQTEIDFSKPIGCSSARRRIQLQKLYPQCTVKSVRGNVLTRLDKLDSGEYSALILAYAGIKRLGLEDRVSRIFETSEILPAACQGILAVQSRKDFDVSFLDEFCDKDTLAISIAERSFIKTLDGGCSSPVAAYGVIENDNIILTGLYVEDDENQYIIKSKTANKSKAEILGKELAIEMREGYING
ncbi:hydroxymethylbilane synthase [Paludicola sp. MB14-C6]|uniref:hydroxymethylbilane synthase n=1 Tax=Paludihabitans sp. MB14-C6 TaxID=3070656 RepID=UPI0027DD1C91|nr:hydroxymethylbilane synthase [Paludicola sp. MB14-C6]WMJ22037.1 hydroxymethylbilane synthase [Paludicola sp. MB14-C6]